MRYTKLLLLVVLIILSSLYTIAQNVGIGTTTPEAKLHIKGSADTSQLIIDANATQSNTNPLIRLRDASGNDILHIHSDAPDNVFIGLNAGRVNDFLNGGYYNTFIGSFTGYSNTTGSYNTATGAGALYSNTNGSGNAANGYSALYRNTTGFYNTANGGGTLFFNTDGSNNTANGYSALYSNTSGDYNTANGVSALFLNTTGLNNTANGYEALYSNTTGSNNTANGYFTLYKNATGLNNTANGLSALYSNISGSSNTANGLSALYSNTNGSGNIANGVDALYSNTTGSDNVANGISALYENTTGFYNTAYGYAALFSTTTAQYNTALGYNSGTGYDFGYNNTFLGANCTANAAGLFNCIAIGQQVTCTASSQARIGNSATNSIGGYANWSNISDGRFKKNIRENVIGLAFILKLRPITYQLDVTGISKELNEMRDRKEWDSGTKKAISEKEQTIFSGFVAQEVEKTANELNYDFSGVDKPKNDKDFYCLRYADFVVPLVKAMQEQQAMIEKQNETIEILKKENEETKTRLEKLEKLLVKQ